jgi:hypothetical protein
VRPKSSAQRANRGHFQPDRGVRNTGRNRVWAGRSIPGCTHQPVDQVGSLFLARCQTSFLAALDTPLVTARFTPSVGVNLEGSRGDDESSVGLGPTVTKLQTSSATPPAKAKVTYTASVMPEYPGQNVPSGPVEFLDGGRPIPLCAHQPLRPGVSYSTATCETAYSTAGEHSLSAIYNGDANFSGFVSSRVAIAVQAQSETEPTRVPSTTTAPATAPAEGESAEASGVPVIVIDRQKPSHLVLVGGGRVRVRRDGVAAVRLRCVGVSLCRGRAVLSVRTASHGRKDRGQVAATTLGVAGFSIPARHTAAVRIELTPRGQAALRADRSLRTSLTIVRAGPQVG